MSKSRPAINFHSFIFCIKLFLIVLMISFIVSGCASLPERLGSVDLRIREQAEQEFEQLTPEEKEKLVPALIKALGDEDYDVRERAADALGKIGSIESKDAVYQYELRKRKILEQDIVKYAQKFRVAKLKYNAL